MLFIMSALSSYALPAVDKIPRQTGLANQFVFASCEFYARILTTSYIVKLDQVYTRKRHKE